MVNRRKEDRLAVECSVYLEYLHQHGQQSMNMLWTRQMIGKNISSTVYAYTVEDIYAPLYFEKFSWCAVYALHTVNGIRVIYSAFCIQAYGIHPYFIIRIYLFF